MVHPDQCPSTFGPGRLELVTRSSIHLRAAVCRGTDLVSGSELSEALNDNP